MNTDRLERDIEKSFLRKLKKEFPDAMIRKMNGFGFRGWPDRMILLPQSITVFIEFKRPGKTVTPNQSAIHEDLRELSFPVEVCTDADEAMRFVRSCAK